MKRRAEHEVYELVTHEWPNGRPRHGAFTFSHEHAEKWAKDGGRVEICEHAKHMPAEQSADVVRRDAAPELAANLARYKREHGAAPQRLEKAEARALIHEWAREAAPERLAEMFALVGAAEVDP